MNLNQLKIFREVAKCNSFTLAAQKLFITQPAVSLQISSLENYFGIKLFDRVGKKIKLTHGGEILLRYTEQIFDITNRAERIVQGLRHGDAGVLEIGVPTIFCKNYIPEIIQKFHKKHPDVKICINSGPSQKIVDNVMNLKNEFGITSRIPYPKEIKFIPFLKEEVLLIFPANHKFSKFKRISFENLGESPLIMRDWGSGQHKLLLEEFKKKQVSPFIIMEIEDMETLIELVCRGIGISFIVKYAVKNQIESGKIKSISFPKKKIYLNFDIIYHKDKKDFSLMNEFLAGLKNESGGVLRELEIFESFKGLKEF